MKNTRYYFALVLTFLFITVTAQIIKFPTLEIKRVISTDGTIASYDPSPPNPRVTLSTSGPYISGVNYAGKIKNLCTNSSIQLSALTTNPTRTKYQWYYSVATKSKTIEYPFKGVSSYSWSTWAEIPGGTSRTLDVDASFLFKNTSVLHIVLYCKITQLSTSYTSVIGISRADAPRISELSVQAAYFCPGEDVTIQADYEASGDQVEVFWERESPSGTGNWAEISSTDPFTFPGATYLDGTYDYRLAIVSSCVNYRSDRLSDIPIVVQQANVESYEPITNATITTCLNSEAEFNLAIQGKNNFFTYKYEWYYKASESATWTKITNTNGGVFADYTTLSLKVTPNNESYHNMQFRCVTTGTCATITSTVFTLKLTVPPTIISISAIDSACVGETVQFTANIEDNPLSTPVEYRWRIGDNIAIGQTFSETNNTFSYTAGTDPVVITCEVQNGDECIGIIDNYSKPLKLYDNPNVVVNVTTTGCGGVTADLTAEVTKGKKPYDFEWTLPDLTTETTQTINNKATNFPYFVSVTDACMFSDTSTVFVASLPLLTLTATKTDVLCFDQANGSISAVVAGGVAPYDIAIAIDNGGTLDTIAFYENTLYGLVNIPDLYAGKYTVSVKDQCNTEKSVDLTIKQPNVLNVAISDYKNVSCHNGGDGYATVDVSGGTSPYVVNWINGQHTETATGLFAGEYIANITDNNGCFGNTKVQISQPGEMIVDIVSKDISCYGANDGSIEVFIEGGAAPLETQISNNIFSSHEDKATSLVEGIYLVSVKDACENIYTEMVSIVEPDSLEIVLTKEDVSCSGRTDGSATVLISNAIEPVSILWSNDDDSETISGLDSAYYTVTVTDACFSGIDSIEVLSPDEISVTISQEDVQCAGEPTGKATAVVEGGTFPFSYTWSNGAKTESISNIYAGDYTVQVIDDNGCFAVNSATVTQNEKLIVSAVVNDVECADESTGSITITTENAVGALLYDWSDDNWDGYDIVENVAAGTYSVIVSDYCEVPVTLNIKVTELHKMLSVDTYFENVSCNGMTDGMIEVSPSNGFEPYGIEWSSNATEFALHNIASDTYSYKVFDACKDTIEGTIEITEPELITLDAITTAPSCYGYGDGTATINVQGGTEPFIYNWNIGLRTNSAKGLFADEYRVNVFDANGCFEFVEFELTEPQPLSVEISSTEADCKIDNGSLQANVSGGTEPYLYVWSNNEETSSISNLAVGKYSLTVTDDNGCEITASTNLKSSVTGYDICMLTVDKEIGKNKIVWEKTINSPITEVKIYRMVGGIFQPMGSVKNSEYSFYDDEISNPEATAARYAITSLDACGNESELSPYHQTIHLGSAKGADEVTNVLDWTEYLDESGEFNPKWYYLYRGTEKNNLQLFDSVDAAVATEYNDLDPQGAKYYRVAVSKSVQCVSTGILKSDSGPYSQSLSNLTEAELTTTGLSEEVTGISLYPNPSDGIFTVSIANPENATIQIFDIGGELVYTKQDAEETTEVDIRNVANGIYTISIENDDRVINSKLIIQK